MTVRVRNNRVALSHASGEGGPPSGRTGVEGSHLPERLADWDASGIPWESVVLTPSITAERSWPYRLRRMSAVSAAGARPLGSVARVAARIMLEYRARRAARQLMALDERMLRDIGLERSEIGHAVRIGTVWRD